MNRSENVKDLLAALSKAQAEMPTVGKAKDNPFFKSKYASQDDMIEASRETLGKYGLSVLQYEIFKDNQIFLQTFIGHDSGQFIVGEVPLKPDKPGTQAYGSCLSYHCRYTYGKMLRLSFHDENDDDGYTPGVHHTEASENDYRITKEQEDMLRNRIGDRKDLAESIFKTLAITHLSQMPKNKFNDAFRFIERNLAAKS